MMMTVLSLSVNAADTKYVEGEHYTQISQKTSMKPEVREYFSFYCPHCYKFGPILGSVKKELPSGVSFKLNHINFMSSASKKVQLLLTKSMSAAQQMKMEKEFVAAIFDRIHVQKKPISSQKDIRDIFIAKGADGKKFDKLLKSFSVNSRFKLMQKNEDVMLSSMALTSVPTVIINGKYRINNEALDFSIFEKDYKNIVKYLLALK